MDEPDLPSVVGGGTATATSDPPSQHSMSPSIFLKGSDGLCLKDRKEGSDDFLDIIPEDVFIKMFFCMPVDDMKKCRLVCTSWNETIISTIELLRSRSCFYFDGRKDDNGCRCQSYLDTVETGCSLWHTIRIRSSSVRHINWLDISKTKTITHLEFYNCSLHWSTVIKVLMEFEQLVSLQDIQDMYSWDYSNFLQGLEEDQSISETVEYPSFLEHGRLDLLSNLRSVKVHRSNIRDCTIYLKILDLRCDRLETLEITTDCNFPQGRSTRMYASLGNVLMKNAGSLKRLRFPFKNIYSQYDFRLTEDQRPFRDFLAFISRENWIGKIELSALTDLHLSFPMVYLDRDDFDQKLKPFLEKQRSLRKLKMSSVNLEPSKEDILLTIAGPEVTTEFDLYVNDGRNIPELTSLIDLISSLSVQTWRVSGTEVKSVLPLVDIDGVTPIDYRMTHELQYFSKSHTFKDFNIDHLVASFSHLTNLNLVDHNTRVEHRHSSEAAAAIEDEHMQTIVRNLISLRTLQVIGNMTYLTDSGLTGIKLEACKRMNRRNSFTKLEGDVEDGLPIANLKELKSLVLRGVGIKVTDVILYFAFGSMERLKKIHIFGSQQTTPAARTIFHQKFPNFKGYDIEV